MCLQILLFVVFELFLAVSGRMKPLREGSELSDWRVDRMIDCIFCLDYDDYKGFAVTGCSVPKPMTCRGNACYMRQHKKANYFLYTTGCVNLTSDEFENINHRISEEHPVAKKRGGETQLCEVLKDHLTCLCANKRRCNNIANADPFSEYSADIFNHRSFNETKHFRYFLPDDPLLQYVDGAYDFPLGFQNVYMMRTAMFSSASSQFTISLLAVLCFAYAVVL